MRPAHSQAVTFDNKVSSTNAETCGGRGEGDKPAQETHHLTHRRRREIRLPRHAMSSTSQYGSVYGCARIEQGVQSTVTTPSFVVSFVTETVSSRYVCKLLAGTEGGMCAFVDV